MQKGEHKDRQTSKLCNLCRTPSRGFLRVTTFGRILSLDHQLGLDGDKYFNCAQRASLKYFATALPVFRPVANRRIGSEVKGLWRERTIQGMFLDLIYYSIRQQRVPKNFIEWLESRGVKNEKTALWHDQFFYVLLIDNKIDLIWPRNEFEVNWNDDIRRGPHGAYVVGNNTPFEISLEEISFRGVRINFILR